MRFKWASSEHRCIHCTKYITFDNDVDAHTMCIKTFHYMVWFRFFSRRFIHTQSVSQSVNKISVQFLNVFFFCVYSIDVDVDVDKRNYLLMNWKSSLKSETVIVYNVIISIHTIADKCASGYENSRTEWMSFWLLSHDVASFHNSHAQMFTKYIFYCEFNLLFLLSLISLSLFVCVLFFFST